MRVHCSPALGWLLPVLAVVPLWTMHASAEAPDAGLQVEFDLAAAIADGPPMTAELAARRTAEHAPSIERAEALNRAAEAAVLRARDQLLPKLELSARYAHVDGFPDGRIEIGGDPEQLAMARQLAAQITDPASRTLWLANLEQGGAKVIKLPRNQVAFAGRVSWPVSDLLFAIKPAIDASRSQVRVSAAQVEARRARVQLDGREGFYQLARARGALAVAQRAVLQARTQKERIDSGVQAGMRAPADGSSATARLAAAEQAEATAEAAVDVADAALRTLLQDPEGARYGIAEPLLMPDNAAAVADVPVLIERAHARRPELRALRDSIAVQDKLTRSAKANGYPHLAVFGGADYARPNRYVIPPSNSMQPSWEVGAALTYVPNDTLIEHHRARENNERSAALAADLQELERALVLEVRKARAALVRSARTIEAARATEAAASDAYQRRLAELHAGEVTTADLFAAEGELNRARLDALDATIEARLASARLAYAVGDQ